MRGPPIDRVKEASIRTAWRAGIIAAIGASLLPTALRGQIVWDDLVFTGGFAVEAYNGNFSSVTVPVVDSTEDASATVGEFGARGQLRIPDANIWMRFDGGIRQFAANGFELRDYAPREFVGRFDAGWGTYLGERAGRLDLSASVRGRNVDDRPPLPLFLQPGLVGIRGAVLYQSGAVQDVRFDLEVDVERTDYDAPDLLAQLDLLDRNSWGVEVGSSFGPLTTDPSTSGWQLRFFTGFRRSEFKDQASFDPSDPFRRDRTVQVGGVWTHQGDLFAEVGVEGTLNRSNSQRPEYDAVSLRGELFAPLPWWELGVNVLGVLTGKSYVHEIPFTRLVPGEEADNASVVFVDVNRAVSPTVDAAVRFGWTRAETDFGNQYYSRFGVTFLMNYRPRL